MEGGLEWLIAAKGRCGLDIYRRLRREVSAPKRQQDSAQVFNPGNRHPDRRALKGRQIERPNNTKVGSKLYTSQLRTLVSAQP
jgi:hypothetical protein